MEWHTILALLFGSGGTYGIAKTIRLLKARPTSEKPIRNGERASILQAIARFDEYFIENAGTLARIEGNIRSSEKFQARRVDEIKDQLSRRLDDLDESVSRLEDRVSRLEDKE